MLLVPVTTQSRTSASRIALVVGSIIILVAPVTLSAGGQVFLGAIAAAMGLVPLLLGPTRYRVLGVFPLVIGAAETINAYPQFRTEMERYSIRGQLAEVVNLGTTIATALDRHRLGATLLPKSIDELGIPVSRERVANVRIESEDRFTMTLSLPAALGKELIFVATSVDGTRTWKCTSGGVDLRLLPGSCRQQFDASIRPDRK